MEKKFYQKWWFWAIMLFVGSAAIYGITNPESYKSSTSNEQDTSNEGVDDTPDVLKAVYVSTVRNDATGNWRVSTMVSPERIDNYKVEYYSKYFKSDDEIHFIVNFTLNTTTKLAVVNGMLNVAVYEYVDGEEHDAKLLGSGMVLLDGFYDKTSGEKIDFSED